MNYSRPDEQAAQAEIERSKKFDKNLSSAGNFVKGVVGTAAGAGLVSKLSPFLNSLIPADLALKGISKVSPKLGKFLKSGMKMGLDLQEGISYLKKGIGGEQEEGGQKARDGRNIIEQYSPELHSAIETQMANGMTPMQAGAILANDKKFEKIVKQMTKDHKVPFAELLEMAYGNEAAALPQQQAPMQAQVQPQQQPAQQAPQNVPAAKTDWSQLLEAIRNG